MSRQKGDQPFAMSRVWGPRPLFLPRPHFALLGYSVSVLESQDLQEAEAQSALFVEDTASCGRTHVWKYSPQRLDFLSAERGVSRMPDDPIDCVVPPVVKPLEGHPVRSHRKSTARVVAQQMVSNVYKRSVRK